jgi:hypothetical protein
MSKVVGSIPELTDWLRDVFTHCDQIGMGLPFTVVTVTNNHIIYGVLIPGGDEPVVELVPMSHVRDMELPINIMIVDKNGEAARATITGPDQISYH